jgi:hypothetical protein
MALGLLPAISGPSSRAQVIWYPLSDRGLDDRPIFDPLSQHPPCKIREFRIRCKAERDELGTREILDSGLEIGGQEPAEAKTFLQPNHAVLDDEWKLTQVPKELDQNHRHQNRRGTIRIAPHNEPVPSPEEVGDREEARHHMESGNVPGVIGRALRLQGVAHEVLG